MAERRHGSSILVWGLVVVLFVLAMVAAATAAAFVLSERFASAAGPWISPLSAVKAGAINPALALASLTDASDQDIVDEALRIGSVDTALATLLYSPSMSDQARSVGLLVLGRRLAQDGQKDRAILVARSAADVAVLSPTMSDYNRTIALTQAGQVMASVGRRDDAAHVYDMAAVIALHSGRLDPSYRTILVEGLAVDYERLGRKDQARSLRLALRSDPPPVDKSSPILPALLVPLTPDDSSAWTDLQVVAARRMDLASALRASLDGQSPTPAETVRQSLEKTLIEEDRLRNHLYDDGISQSDNLLHRAAYARARVEWLIRKWQIARQGFGMALVPAWENQVRDIEADLRKALDDYYLIVRDVAVSLPEQLEAAQAAVEVIQDQIKLGRLGMPTSTQEAELIRALDGASRALLNLGGKQLYITINNDKGKSQLTVVSNQ